MKNILRPDQTSEILSQLSVANKSFDSNYPGKSLQRQPVHTIYGGAHLFKAETAQKLYAEQAASNAGENENASDSNGDDVVDAEFEEVDEEKEKEPDK